MKEIKTKVLFVNSCMRSKGISRTYALASRFIDRYELQNPRHEITHIDLVTERIFPLTYFDIEMQSKNLWGKRHYAQQFATYDKFIIAAPVWNASCPAALNAYIERICLSGTTYERTDTGFAGLCNGKKALYISTMGSIRQPDAPTGAEYIREIFARFGIDDFVQIRVEGMDTEGANTQALLEKAMRQCDILAATW